ncbi:hypothetical protein C8R48DRAFT_768916 [Suillus tomentosus]|nr:hypothetical protein C8R48DRAFT_835659 [Suillus tomentosus]KAG1876075.1 hypothetical protein C8R48DRAFT_768916 [Suillus tomentosus]
MDYQPIYQQEATSSSVSLQPLESEQAHFPSTSASVSTIDFKPICSSARVKAAKQGEKEREQAKDREDKEVIRASGLGVEDMNQDELTEMLKGEGEEVGFEFAASQSLTNMEDADSTMHSADDDPESLELVEDIGTELGPTQDDVGGRKKVFQPLFED